VIPASNSSNYYGCTVVTDFALLISPGTTTA